MSKITIKIVSDKKDQKEQPNIEWKSLNFMHLSNYVVSNMGGVKSIKTGRLLKGTINNGYIIHTLTNDHNIKKNKFQHVLVASAFIPNPENKRTVNHRNKTRSDNRVDNLEWATHSEQGIHRGKPKYRGGRPIFQLDEKGNIIKRWERLKDASLSFNVYRSRFSYACKNKTQVCGYYWMYVDEHEGDLPNEKWLSLPEGKYFISSEGRYKYPSGKITYGNDFNGYLVVVRKCNNKEVTSCVHALVAEMFIRKRNDGEVVNHIDGNRSNNKLENLEIVTSSENTKHAIKIGLTDYSKRSFNRRAVLQFSKNNEFIKEYRSAADAEKETSICDTGITRVCKGKGSTSGGFIWKYK